MKLNRRVAFVLLSSLAGAIGLYLYCSASINGSLVEWESLGKPPGGATKVISQGLVETTTGDVYDYTYQQNCVDGCWIKSDASSSDSEFFLPLESCIDLPPLDNFVNSMGFCEPWGPGISLTVYAIDSNGFVYYWNHRRGEWDWPAHILSPFIGAFIGFFVSLPILLVVSFNDLLEWLQRRAQQRETVRKA